MINADTEAQILRLHHAERWPVGTIARQLGIHHSVVRRVLGQAGVTAGRHQARPSKVDPYVPFIIETLEKWPKLQASRIYEMVKARGYPGQPDHFRSIVARFRPRRPAEAYARLRTLPGEQAQVDWGHFGKITVGQAERHLMAFVMVLSHSRMIFLRFYLNARMESFLRGHLDAFEHFGGVPRVLLYDNLKSAVLERVGDAIRFNPRLLELASHHAFEPRPVGVARGNEKGRVERAIRYIRGSFFAARSWKDLDDLNRQAEAFCVGLAADRRSVDDAKLTVREAFEQEQAMLLPLPATPFPDEDRQVVKIGKTPYARYDGNDYSVPHTHVQRELTVMASPSRVRILDGLTVLADHERCWDRGRQLETREHLEGLVAAKKRATRHAGQARLYAAVPRCKELIILAAQHGGNLGTLVAGLLRQLDLFGASLLDEAVAEVLVRGVPRLAAVRQELDRRRHSLGQAPPVAVPVPEDPRLKAVVVRPHDLGAYDAIRTSSAQGANHE